MRITHVVGLFSPEHGGPANELPLHCRRQAAAGHAVSVRVLEGFPGTSPAIRLDPPIDWFAGRVAFPSRLGRSPGLRTRLRQDPSPDVYHLHGAWLRAMYYGAVEARRRQRPYLVHLMGMYERYALGQKRLRKAVARVWFQDRVLRGAACLHVNSPAEAADLRRLGFTNPIALVPVGVDVAGVARLQSLLPRSCPWPELVGREFLLFLSRLHPKKGIDLLLEAWARLSPGHPNHSLLVAGTGTPEYIRACREKAKTLGIGRSVVWAGHVDEIQRCWAYSNAAFYVLPTYSENFGNTVAEALAHGTPVLTTTGTPWRHLSDRGCGWIASPTVNSLVEQLSKALESTSAQRQLMGSGGRKLVEERYSLTAALEALDAIYHWVLGRAGKPACLFGQ